MHRAPVAWMVVSHDGAHRALFLERARAERWAPDCHGTVHPLYLWPDPVPEGEPVMVQPEWDKPAGDKGDDEEWASNLERDLNSP